MVASIREIDLSEIAKKHNAVVTIPIENAVQQKYGLMVIQHNGFFLSCPIFLGFGESLKKLLQNVSGQSGKIGTITARNGKKYVYRGWFAQVKELAPDGLEYLTVPFVSTFPQTVREGYVNVAGLLYQNVLIVTSGIASTPASRELLRDLVDEALTRLEKKKFRLQPSENQLLEDLQEMMLSEHARLALEHKEMLNRETQERDNYLALLVEKEKKIRALQLSMDVKKTLGEEEKKKIVQFLTLAQKSSKVKKIESYNGAVRITFQNLVLRWREEEKTMNLPNLVVDFSTMGTFRVRAEENYGDAIPHPHILGSGQPCLGNYMTIYAKLLRNGEYSQLFTLILEYLETYNDDSPYISWTRLERIISQHNRGENDEQEEEDEEDSEQ